MRFFNLVFCMVMAVGFVGCSSKDVAPQRCSTALEDDSVMQKYMVDNGVTGVKHEKGLYYEIITEGTGVAPTINSNVKVKYVGKFTNNKTFDQAETGFPLSRVIEGWQIGIPLIKQGGKIKLIIPPYLGYGCYDYSKIPGNSVLVFDVELLEVE